MPLFFLFIFALLTSYSVVAQEIPPPNPVKYYVAQMGSQPIDHDKPTHFFIANYGRELITLFQEAATGRLRRLQEVFPDHQFILIAYNQTQTHSQIDNRALLKKWGYSILKAETYYGIYDDTVINEMKPFQKIHSLDVFSHGSIYTSVFSAFAHYTPNDIHFVPTATISFYGCNTGYDLAFNISRMFKVPVAGSLTSSDFQRLHELHDFFRNDESLKPSTGKWSTVNTLSFSQPVNCSQGVCVRMKPDEFTYSGMHGTYSQGLPYYKFTCYQLSEQQCLQARAQWILGVLSLKPLSTTSSLEDYKEVVRDVLCPNNAKNNIKADCTQKLIEAESDPSMVYSPFKGDMPLCDWQGCNFAATSKTTFIEEYFLFLNAYPYLIQAQ